MASHNFLLKPLVAAAFMMVAAGILALMSWMLVTVQRLELDVAGLSVKSEAHDEEHTTLRADMEKVRTRWQFVP